MAANVALIKRPILPRRRPPPPAVSAHTREQREYEQRLQDLEERTTRLELLVGLRQVREDQAQAKVVERE